MTDDSAAVGAGEPVMVKQFNGHTQGSEMLMLSHDNTLVSSGHGFLECPRWHDGRLWVSDHITHEVKAIDPDGSVEVIARLQTTPSGLGFSPEHGVLVVSMEDRKLLRLDDSGDVTLHADFSGISTGVANDMQLHPAGFAWIGINPPLNGGIAAKSRLVLVGPDGGVHETGGHLHFPNGMALAPGGVLLVAETFGHRITAFDIDSDTGDLTNQRQWAELPSKFRPDGIALDADGGVWFANVLTLGSRSGFYRVIEGGEITDVVPTPGLWAVAPGFGGPNLDVLYLCVCETSFEQMARHEGEGSVLSARVGRSGVCS